MWWWLVAGAGEGEGAGDERRGRPQGDFLSDFKAGPNSSNSSQKADSSDLGSVPSPHGAKSQTLPDTSVSQTIEWG